jgi:hypothetical protein
MLGLVSLSGRFAAVINVNRSRMRVGDVHRNGGTSVHSSHRTRHIISLLDWYYSRSSHTSPMANGWLVAPTI